MRLFRQGDSEAALLEASERGDLRAVVRSIQQGTNSDAMRYDGETALMLASRYGHLEVVKFLVDAGAVNDVMDSDGYTALMLASSSGHVDVVKSLVGAGANIESTSKLGSTALLSAALDGQVEVDKFLVSLRADLDAVRSTNGWTALLLAAQGGHMDIVRWLATEGADIPYALTFLIVNGDVDLARTICESGVDINQRNRHGQTPLALAVSKHNLDVVRALLDLGAKAAVVDSKGDSILFSLLARDDLDEQKMLPIAKLLLGKGMPALSFNHKSKSARSIARAKNYHDLVDLLDGYASRHAREPEAERSPASL